MILGLKVSWWGGAILQSLEMWQVNPWFWKIRFIREYDALGVSVRVYRDNDNFTENYYNFLESLKSSKDKRYNEVYNELVAKGYTDSASVPILGVIVYGTKDELKSLIGNPYIKASSPATGQTIPGLATTIM